MAILLAGLIFAIVYFVSENKYKDPDDKRGNYMSVIFDNDLGVYIASEVKYNHALVSSDPSRAMTFASEEDAQAFMDRLGLSHKRFEIK